MAKFQNKDIWNYYYGDFQTNKPEDFDGFFVEPINNAVEGIGKNEEFFSKIPEAKKNANESLQKLILQNTPLINNRSLEADRKYFMIYLAIMHDILIFPQNAKVGQIIYINYRAYIGTKIDILNANIKEYTPSKNAFEIIAVYSAIGYKKESKKAIYSWNLTIRELDE